MTEPTKAPAAATIPRWRRRIKGLLIVPVVLALIIPFFHFFGEAAFGFQRGYRWLAIEITLWSAALWTFIWSVWRSGFPPPARFLGGGVLLLVGGVFFGLFKFKRDADLIPYGIESRWVVKRYQQPPQGGGPALVARPREAAGIDSPQFLGLRGKEALSDIRLSADWKRHPPRELWRIDVGAGWSSFAIAGDHVFTQEQQGDAEVVTCYQLRTGKLVWRHADRGGFSSAVSGDGPRATPTLDGERVYTVGGTGRLNCLDIFTGDAVWSKDILSDLGAELDEWGKSCSPLVLDKLVVVTGGDRTGPSLVAYDKDKGDRVWTAAWGPDAGDQGTTGKCYASPELARLHDTDQILNLEETGVAAYDPASGEQLWRHDWPWNEFSPRASQPRAVSGNRVFLSAGYASGSALIQVDRDETGRFSARPLWTNKNLRTKLSNVVFHDGHIYGLDGRIMACLDVETGERKWKRGRYGYGQLLLVGDLILVTTEKGDLVLVEATPEGHRELGRFKAISDRTWNIPAFSVLDLNSDVAYLLVRNAKEAACFELRREKAKGETLDTAGIR